MPHVSKIKLDKRLETQLFNSLETALGKLSKEETKAFLLSLISPTERLMLAKRLAVVILLKEDVPIGTIASTLHVTKETVGRIHLQSQVRGDGYNIVFNKLQNEKFLKDFKSFLLKLAGYSIRASTGYVKPEIL